MEWSHYILHTCSHCKLRAEWFLWLLCFSKILLVQNFRNHASGLMIYWKLFCQIFRYFSDLCLKQLWFKITFPASRFLFHWWKLFRRYFVALVDNHEKHFYKAKFNGSSRQQKTTRKVDISGFIMWWSSWLFEDTIAKTNRSQGWQYI